MPGGCEHTGVRRLKPAAPLYTPSISGPGLLSLARTRPAMMEVAQKLTRNRASSPSSPRLSAASPAAERDGVGIQVPYSQSVLRTARRLCEDGSTRRLRAHSGLHSTGCYIQLDATFNWMLHSTGCNDDAVFRL